MPSSAVTFTLNVLPPASSATWRPAAMASASASVASLASSQATVASAWFFVAVTVTVAMS